RSTQMVPRWRRRERPSRPPPPPTFFPPYTPPPPRFRQSLRAPSRISAQGERPRSCPRLHLHANATGDPPVALLRFAAGRGAFPVLPPSGGPVRGGAFGFERGQYTMVGGAILLGPCVLAPMRLQPLSDQIVGLSKRVTA